MDNANRGRGEGAKAPAIGYASPPGPPAVPEYPEILFEANVVRTFAGFVLLAGWVLIGAGLVWGGSVAFQAVRQGAGQFVAVSVFVVVLVGLAPIVAGVACIIVAAMLRLAAATAVAHRDMVRNSFRR